VEDWCVQCVTRILYIQNKRIGSRLVVITLFNFTLFFVEKRDKGMEMKDIQGVRKKMPCLILLKEYDGVRNCKYNVSKQEERKLQYIYIYIYIILQYGMNILQE